MITLPPVVDIKWCWQWLSFHHLAVAGPSLCLESVFLHGKFLRFRLGSKPHATCEMYTVTISPLVRPLVQTYWPASFSGPPFLPQGSRIREGDLMTENQKISPARLPCPECNSLWCTEHFQAKHTQTLKGSSARTSLFWGVKEGGVLHRITIFSRGKSPIPGQHLQYLLPSQLHWRIPAVL